MKQTVYVDVLLAINFFMNYFLLLSAGRILRAAVSRTRICLAAAAGAAAALSIFLPPMNVLVGGLFKLTVSAMMVLIAYRWQGSKAFVRSMLVTCAVTFGFGGTMFALWLTVAPKGMYYRNGVTYFNISPAFIMIVTILCYTVITAAGKISLRLERLSGQYDAVIHLGQKAVKLRLMSDTGNCLTEPFSGLPVIVVRRGAIATLLPPHFAQCTSSPAGIPPGVSANFRVIPCATVSGNGLLTAFRPDSVTIGAPGRPGLPIDCYIAVTDRFEREEYDGIMNPNILH